MRHKNWMLLVGGLLVAQGAAAGDEREDWDDSHMRSRHQQAAPPSNRVRIEGTSGYAQLLNGGAETKTEVATQLEFTTQREWAQGPLSTSSSPKATGPSPSRSSPPTRGSQLRAGSVHSRR